MFLFFFLFGRTGGVIELNKMAGVEANLNVIMNRMNNQKRRIHPVNEVGTVHGAEQNRAADQGLAQEGA